MMIQIALDCQDPHTLVKFWAEALGYEVEDHTELVDGLVSAGQLPEAATVTTARGRRAFADIATARDPGGNRPRLFLQRVPESKTVKNRVHLDLQVGAEAAPGEVERLTALGATFAWVSNDRGGLCTTLRDPEGNEFCVT